MSAESIRQTSQFFFLDRNAAAYVKPYKVEIKLMVLYRILKLPFSAKFFLSIAPFLCLRDKDKRCETA